MRAASSIWPGRANGGQLAGGAYTAVGFPKVFYLKYHGYAAYFPTLALGRYGRLMRGNSRVVNFGFHGENQATRQKAASNLLVKR